MSLCHLFSQFCITFIVNRIEVIHGSVGSTKIDGLVEAKENEELLLIFEFAGGNVSAFNSKFDNDVQKVYTNALHVLETRQQLKIFTAAYFGKHK